MSSYRIEQLQDLLRKPATSSEPAVRIALERLHSELLTRGRNFAPSSSDFFIATLKALRRFKGTGNSEQRLLCLHRCLTYFYHQDNFLAALDAARTHLSLATRVRARGAMRTSLSAIAVINSELGNIAEALIAHSQAFVVTHNLGDPEGEALVLNNLGHTLNYAGLYRDAIPCFERVIAIASPTWKLPLGKRALTNLAQSYYYSEDFDHALHSIRAAVQTDRPPATAEEHRAQTIREFTLVQIALEIGQDDLAIEHSIRCSAHAQAASSLSTKVMADIASARCEIRSGHMRNGLARLEQALVTSSTIDSLFRDALIAIVKAYDETGLPETALAHMEALLRMTRDHATNGCHSLQSASLPIDRHARIVNFGLMSAERRHAHLRARVAERKVASSKLEMIERLAVTADLKEDASGEHGYRVGKLAALLASSLGWTDESAHDLEIAARLHDIGKIGIPDRILGSSQTLKEAERHFMCMHTVIGAELLAQSDVPQLRMGEEIARHHHEWWNGEGYPDKLKEKRIPIHARIVAIADVFDALTHGRPFASPWGIDRALEEIRARRERQFDPQLVDRFVPLVEKLRAEHPDLDSFLSKAGNTSPFLHARKKIRNLLEEERGRTAVHLVHDRETRH